MALTYHVLDVFTERAFGGNPLAVVLDADKLSSSDMQTIAREFNLSETVFVLTPAVRDTRRVFAFSRRAASLRSQVIRRSAPPSFWRNFVLRSSMATAMRSSRSKKKSAVSASVSACAPAAQHSVNSTRQK